MTEYWKSQPRRFCEICKCWFGDNKASIQHHEQGVRHKNNVQKRIKEARQKSRDQEEQMKTKSYTLREIEKAALQAYEKDLVSNPARRHDSAVRDAIQRRKQAAALGGSVSTQWSAAAAAAAYFTNPQPSPLYSEGETVVGRNAKVVRASSASSSIDLCVSENLENSYDRVDDSGQWVKGLSPEGYTYYYNTSTGEATWEKPEGYVELETDETTREESEEEKKPVVKEETDSSTDVGNSLDEGSNLSADSQIRNPTGVKRQQHERVDPYGAWTTVRLCEPVDPTVPDKTDQDNSSEDENDDEDFSFKEKTYPSDDVKLPVHVKQEAAPAFKKRKVNAKRAQFRRQTDNN